MPSLNPLLLSSRTSDGYDEVFLSPAVGRRIGGHTMALIAIAIPILPDKMEQWRAFVGELNGGRKRDFQESRRRVGLHERTFLQHTPMGSMVIVTLEGDDPAGSFAKIFQADDEFTRWFVQQVKDTHGFDLTQPMPGPMPELIADSGA